MKKLILLVVVFFLCAAPVPQLGQPEIRVPTAGMSEKAEKDFVEYVFNAVNDYIQTVDWNENRSYQPEINEVGKIIKRYGYTKDQYFCAAQGARVKIYEDNVLKSERIQIIGVKVILEGNTNVWEWNWENPDAEFPELEQAEPEAEKLDV